jgi:hypothetical protein
MNSQQKIGILTFHRCINYGSYWQARCLVDGLQACGHDAVLLDYNSRHVNRAEWKCALRPTLPTAVPTSDYALYRRKIRKFFQAFDSLPLSPSFDLNDPASMESYDTIVIGSDEVWNLSHPWFGGCTLFYGTGIRVKRLISYAASFGNYDASTRLEPCWVNRLRDFAAISVRDDNSRRVIQTALGFEPELVLDPCLQFPPSPKGEWHGPQQSFLAVYGHNFSPSFSREIRRWAQKRGYLLVSIGYRNDWADIQWITAGPHDFAHAIARAEALATNFFHGCIFALCNARPFVCETSCYRSHKIQSIMAAVSGEKHLVSPGTPAAIYDVCLSEPPASAIVQKIDCLKRASEAYLDKALA